MRFVLIARLSTQHSVRLLCRTLNVSASGFYAWRHRGDSRRVREDRELARKIVEIHSESRGRYGTPRVQKALVREGTKT